MADNDDDDLPKLPIGLASEGWGQTRNGDTLTLRQLLDALGMPDDAPPDDKQDG